MQGTYLFVDGGYLRTTLMQRTVRVYGEAVRPSFAAMMGRVQAEKVFFFDCEAPESDQGEVDPTPLSAGAVRQAVLGAERCHYVEGYLTQGKRTRQKGVDVALAVFTLDFALRNVIQKAVILAGDGDFLYLVDALVKHGTIVSIWADPKSVSRDLRQRADEFIAFDTSSIAQLIPGTEHERLGLPSGLGGTPAAGDEGNFIETRASTAGDIEIWEHAGQYRAFAKIGEGISHKRIEFVRAWLDDIK